MSITQKRMEVERTINTIVGLFPIPRECLDYFFQHSGEFRAVLYDTKSWLTGLFNRKLISVNDLDACIRNQSELRLWIGALNRVMDDLNKAERDAVKDWRTHVQ